MIDSFSEVEFCIAEMVPFIVLNLYMSKRREQLLLLCMRMLSVHEGSAPKLFSAPQGLTTNTITSPVSFQYMVLGGHSLSPAKK